MTMNNRNTGRGEEVKSGGKNAAAHIAGNRPVPVVPMSDPYETLNRHIDEAVPAKRAVKHTPMPSPRRASTTGKGRKTGGSSKAY